MFFLRFLPFYTSAHLENKPQNPLRFLSITKNTDFNFALGAEKFNYNSRFNM